MKYIQVYTLFLMSVFLISCGQNQTYAPPDIIKTEIKDTVTSYGPNSMVRNVKQARNGNILIASYTGVFRYDGKSFLHFTTKDGLGSNSALHIYKDKAGKSVLSHSFCCFKIL